MPAPQPLPCAPTYLGMTVSGDVADWTLYQTLSRRVIVYPASPPKEPPSSAQRAHRARFCRAIREWREASEETRDNYETASIRAALPCTGLNLWIHAAFRPDNHGLPSLALQTSTVLPPPPSAYRPLET